jgi:hypothetical protein
VLINAPAGLAPPQSGTHHHGHVALRLVVDAVKSRIGHASWATTSDRAARTSAGTKAFLERFGRHVDPDGVLSADAHGTMAQRTRTAPADVWAAWLGSLVRAAGADLHRLVQLDERLGRLASTPVYPPKTPAGA